MTRNEAQTECSVIIPPMAHRSGSEDIIRPSVILWTNEHVDSRDGRIWLTEMSSRITGKKGPEVFDKDNQRPLTFDGIKASPLALDNDASLRSPGHTMGARAVGQSDKAGQTHMQ